MALGINTKEAMLFVAAAIVVLFVAFIEIIYVNLQISIINRSDEIEEPIDLARREGVGRLHESYVFGIGKIFNKRNALRWTAVPIILRPRPHITVFYSGMVLVLLGDLFFWSPFDGSSS